MTITKNIDGTKCTIALAGRLDTVTAPEFEAVVNECAENAAELIIDLKDLEYTSSAGLRVFLKAQKAMMQKGSLKIINVNETITDIF
ncbi:MAG: STAS domain-containing protein, partial [Clostridia bacterium]|nr:STAS domain-containing protein [Clostridia bacterium]